MQVLGSNHQKVHNLNFTRVQFKIATYTVWRSARETRKCPEVQSFAVNADELGKDGGKEYVSGQAASASRVVRWLAAVCRLHPFPFLCRPPGPDCPASLLCTSSSQPDQPSSRPSWPLIYTSAESDPPSSLVLLCMYLYPR